MANGKVSSTATVVVTMEIQTDGSSWGAGCTVEQVHKQARDQAFGFLSRLKHDHREIVGCSMDRVKVITHEEEKPR